MRQQKSGDRIQSKRKKVLEDAGENFDERKESKKLASARADLISRVSEKGEAVGERSRKRRRGGAVEGDDLGKKERRRKSESKRVSDGETVVASSGNARKKKGKGKDLRDVGAIALEGREKDACGDDKLEERDEVNEPEKTKRKKKKGRDFDNLVEEIDGEKKRKREGEESLKDGSKTNKRAKASKSQERGRNKNKEKEKELAGGDTGEKKENLRVVKKVHFSDEVKVLLMPTESEMNAKLRSKNEEDEDLVWGKRFTEEEDAIILRAIDEFIKVSALLSTLVCSFPKVHMS